MPITATAHRRGGYAHDVEVDGHSILVDEPEVSGGANEGPSPTRLVAGALASCTAITVEMYAGRKGWDLGEVEVEVVMKGSSAGERSFDVLLRVPEPLDDSQQERLLVIAGKCPVHKMLAGETAVEIADRIECQG